jgi:hypothetical protein
VLCPPSIQAFILTFGGLSQVVGLNGIVRITRVNRSAFERTINRAYLPTEDTKVWGADRPCESGPEWRGEPRQKNRRAFTEKS